MSRRSCSRSRMAWFEQLPSSALSCWSGRHCWYCRMTRRTSTPAVSRSRSRSAAVRPGASCSTSRLVLTNSFGSASNRSRTTGPLSRHARYRSPTSRVDSPSGAIPRASCSQSSALARAIGTRCFIAAWAPIRPLRTSSCTVSGSSLTRARRRDTQLGLRSNRRASSSRPSPKTDSSSCSSHPCSSADSASAERSDRLRTSASASLIAHTVALTVS
jgi:hypothetical protein